MANDNNYLKQKSGKRVLTSIGIVIGVIAIVSVAFALGAKDARNQAENVIEVSPTPTAEVITPAPTATPMPTNTAIAVPSSSEQATDTPKPKATKTSPQTTPSKPTATATSVPTETTEPTQTLVPSTATAIIYPTATVCGKPGGWVIYVVQANDTLYSLATATHTTVSQLRLANCLNSNLIYIGQRLYLPFIPAPTPTGTPTEVPTLAATETPMSFLDTPTPDVSPTLPIELSTATSTPLPTATATSTPVSPIPTPTP